MILPTLNPPLTASKASSRRYHRHSGSHSHHHGSHRHHHSRRNRTRQKHYYPPGISSSEVGSFSDMHSTDLESGSSFCDTEDTARWATIGRIATKKKWFAQLGVYVSDYTLR